MKVNLNRLKTILQQAAEACNNDDVRIVSFSIVEGAGVIEPHSFTIQVKFWSKDDQ